MSTCCNWKQKTFSIVRLDLSCCIQIMVCQVFDLLDCVDCTARRKGRFANRLRPGIFQGSFESLRRNTCMDKNLRVFEKNSSSLSFASSLVGPDTTPPCCEEASTSLNPSLHSPADTRLSFVSRIFSSFLRILPSTLEAPLSFHRMLAVRNRRFGKALYQE